VFISDLPRRGPEKNRDHAGGVTVNPTSGTACGPAATATALQVHGRHLQAVEAGESRPLDGFSTPFAVHAPVRIVAVIF
jgi:hypothetical protein